MEGQLTLSELNILIKETLEISFPEQLWLVTEIGELKVNRTGHCYLELVEKDPDSESIIARSRATIWSWQYRFIKPYFETTTGQTLMAGLKILVAVSVEFHEVYGISLNIKDIDPNYTLGDMARKRQEVINRLTSEGIIDMNKEIPLADIPSRIAVISSPTAAGYEDFINQLHNNTKGFIFYTKLFPSTMQGKEAVNSIINSLDQIYLYEDVFDVVVIIRGGGSQMDLSCFDDYELASHIAQFPIPVLTGIGHEKDESVADMVANIRLKTPTAVAGFLIEQMGNAASEMQELEENFFQTVENILQLEEQRLNQAYRLFKPLVKARLDRTEMQLKQQVKAVKPLVNELIKRQQFKLIQLSDHIQLESLSMLKEESNRFKNMASAISYLSKIKLGKETYLVDEHTQFLKNKIKRKLEKETAKLDWLEKNRQLVDPQNILNRGFSITLIKGKAIKSAECLNDNDTIETILAKGKIKSKVYKP